MTHQAKLLQNADAVDSVPEAQYHPDVIADWALHWERRLRAEASEVDLEVSQLCSRIRFLLDSLEDKNVH